MDGGEVKRKPTKLTLNPHGSKPMMKCGCAASATMNGKPVCFPCYGIREGADVVDDSPPDLAGRTARCDYYGIAPAIGARDRHRWSRRSSCGTEGACKCEKPSSTDLAYFEYQRTQDHDRFYCGCHGWD